MYKQDGMYSQPQLSGTFELGNIFDDIANVAGKVGDISGKVRQIGGEVSDVASGRKQVYTAPTGGSGTILVPVPGQPYGVSIPLMPILLGGGALLAVYLLSRRR